MWAGDKLKTSMATIVETKNLTKAYGGLIAVNKLSIKVEEGEIFGFLGPNGAGKTTTILMLLGLTEPTSGSALVCGFNPDREPIKIKRIAGYMPEHTGFYEELSALDNLWYTARLNGINTNEAESRIKESLKLVELSDVANHKVETYSRGMKQRLGVADVLIKKPKVFIMDEPTTGIDPDGVHKMLDLIVGLSKEHKITIILSSHLLQQVQRICDRVAILVRGRMVAMGAVDSLGKELRGRDRYITELQLAEQRPAILDAIKAIEGVTGIEKSGDLTLIRSTADVRPQIAQKVFEMNGVLLHLKSQDYTLDEIYMKYFRGAV